MLIDIQLNPANNSWPRLRDAVLQAETEGYNATWVFDHFDGAMLQGGADMLECFTLLGALAAATTTIGLGTLVANITNRHPGVLAAAASSAQRISGGRLILGLGAGSAPGSPFAVEHETLGIPLRAPMAARHDALAEQIEFVRRLWSAPPGSPYANFALRGPHPPIIIGTNSVALSRLAGRIADGLNVQLTNPNARQLIDAALEVAGDRPFEISAYAIGTADQHADRAEAMGCHRFIAVDLGPLT